MNQNRQAPPSPRPMTQPVRDPLHEYVWGADAAGEGPWRRAHYVHDAGVTVYYLPWGTVELHRQLDKIITPLPAEPEPPAFLRDGLTAAERERINEVTRGMGRVDIPF